MANILPRERDSTKGESIGAAMLGYGIMALLLGLCFSQLHWQSYFATPLLSNPTAQAAAKTCLVLLIPLLSWLFLSSASDTAKIRFVALVFSLFCAGYCEVLHIFVVDAQNPDPTYHSNFEWQWNMQHAVMALSPTTVPHSYRFLPNCVVSLYQWLCGSFYVSVHTYRLLANTLLYAAIFRYARVYLIPLCAFGTMLAIAALYPATILRYNGQFTDPASHLSFALCLYCLATGREAGFQASFFTGIFAKESILALAFCRAFYGTNRTRAILLAAVYLVAGIAVAYAVRRYVNGGPLPAAFQSISGTSLSEVNGNLINWHVWWGMYLVTLGALAPGAIAGWRLADASLRATCVILLAATVSTNLFISIMWEVRNIVPAFIPLAVLNFKYIETLLPKSSPPARATP